MPRGSLALATAFIAVLLPLLAAVPIVGEASAATQEVVVTVPEGAVVGQKLRFQAPGSDAYYEVAVPANAVAGAQLTISVPAPLPPPPPPPRVETPPPQEELLLTGVPSAVGLDDTPSDPPPTAVAAIDEAAPAATGLVLQTDEEIAADAVGAAADAGEAVSVGLGPARDHPEGEDSPPPPPDREGPPHYRVLAVPHCGTNTEAPAASFRSAEELLAAQQSVFRFCWDETHLQLASAMLSDGDVVGAGGLICAGSAASFDGGDIVKLSLSSGSDTPTRWLELTVSATGGVAMTSIGAGDAEDRTFDCAGAGTASAITGDGSRTGSSTRSRSGKVINSVMLGGNADDESGTYGLDEAASEQHTVDVSVQNRTYDGGSNVGTGVGWRVTARLPWRLLNGGGGTSLHAGEEQPAKDSGSYLVRCQAPIPIFYNHTRVTKTLGSNCGCLLAGEEVAGRFLANRRHERGRCGGDVRVEPGHSRWRCAAREGRRLS